METQPQNASPELCQTLFAETTEGIFISDAQGRFLEVNPAGCEWLGYSRAELLQLSWRELLPGEDLGPGLPGLAEGGESQTARIKGQLRGKNGRSCTGEIRLRGLADGRRVALVHNLGEHLPADETQHPYELLATHSGDIILILSYSNGRIVEANASATEIYGYSREELLTLSIQDLRAPETHALTAAQMAQAQAQGILFETIHRRKDGSTFMVEVNSKGAIINGVSVLISVIRNISERKQAENALRQSEEKYRQLFSEMSSGCALHEIIGDNKGRPVDYITLEVNHAYESLLNAKGEAIIGQKASEILPPAELEKWLAIFGPVALTGESTHYEMFSPFNQRHFEGSAYCPGTGKFAVTFTDVTERKRAEQELHIALEKYRVLFETFPLGISVTDAAGNLLEVNQESERLLGISRQDHTRRTYDGPEWHIIHPDGTFMPPDEYASVRAFKEKRLVENVEMGIVKNDGEITWLSVTAAPIPLEDYGVAIAYGDITERKRTEMALQESEERFRLFMDNSPTIAWIQDNQSRYVYLNQTYEKRFGVRLEAWRGKTIFEVWPVEVAQQLWQNDQKVLAADHLSEFTEEIPNLDGSLSTWWSFKFPFRDASGQRYAAGIGLDITERKAAEEALRISEARYRLIADRLNDIIWQLDQELRFVYTSPAVEHILGYSVEETNQLSITDLLDAEGLALMSQAISRKLDHPEEKIDTITEYKMRHKAGHMVEVEVVSAPIFDVHGQCKGFTGVTRDIRERKHAQAARIKLEEQLHQAQKMESIGRLAGGVAHDFNNHLTVILGYSELMQTRLPLSSAALEQLEQIRQSAKRAEGLTRQLLAFSRKQVLAPEVFDLNELITNLRKMLERLIGEDIALTTTLQPDLWWVKVDPGQIEQVIMNLVVNARDAMPTGGRLTLETVNVTLEDRLIQTYPETLNGPSIRLTVTDTGYGMDKATRSQIFEPFFTTKEPGKGTGLGLATVYGIIKQSEGEITVDSQPGQGTTFTLYLPAHDPVLTGSAVPQSEPVAQPGHETILLVEDEQTVRDFVRVALRDYGYTLLEVDHGYQALALAQQEKSIDLLLTDVVMPDINGRELAERVQALHPRIKVLFMSGYTDDEVIRRGILMAEVEFMAKPFSPIALAAKVREMLDR